jgi:dTDP-glucose pyrophosphorylase
VDTGTPVSLLAASEFIRALEKSQGFNVTCAEQIAHRADWISREALNIQTFLTCGILARSLRLNSLKPVASRTQ